MKILLVAERMNWTFVPRWHDAMQSDVPRWLEISLRCGAFGCGMTAIRQHLKGDGPNTKRLMSLYEHYDRDDLKWWTHAMNLLPPSPVCGEWSVYDAARVGAELRERLELARQQDNAVQLVSMRREGCLSNGLTDRWLFDKIVAVGHRPANALQLDRQGFFERSGCGRDGRYIVVPHPSGRSRWWNEPTNIAAGRVALREFLLG